MGAEIQVANFMRWRARKTIWKYTLEMRWAKYKYKYTLEMRWAKYKYKYTLVRNELAAKWGGGGGWIGKIGGMGTISEGGL